MKHIELYLLPLLTVTLCGAESAPDYIAVAPDNRGFVWKASGERFVPLGHNYSNAHRLTEDYWDAEWPVLEHDFAGMKALGTTVVRVHLQTGKFLNSPTGLNGHSFEQLDKLLKLAEKEGLFLDLTGLACYRTADVPKWYDALSDAERWAAQAVFWEAVAAHGAKSRAVFCYDLINEPLAPSGKRKPGDWYSGKPFGGYDYLQFIALDLGARKKDELVADWIRMLSAAIHKADPHRLVTVGMLPRDPKWGYFSGFVPEKVAPEVDFVSVHIYPEKGKVADAIKMLKGYAVGKPVVIEETFALSCSADELRDFLKQSHGIASGWIGHFDGLTPQEYEKLKQDGKLTLEHAAYWGWEKLFMELRGELGLPVTK